MLRENGATGRAVGVGWCRLPTDHDNGRVAGTLLATRPAEVAGAKTVARDPILDLLKAVGLLGIVIAHTNPPGWLYQLRNFGIPTMAFVAGAVMVESLARREASTAAYLRRRVKQLFVPTWVFLTVGGAVLMLLSTLADEAWNYSAGKMLRAFLLLDGAAVTNTQVVRVFLLLSVSAPLWLALRRRVPRVGPGLLALAGLWVGYELVCWAWAGWRHDAPWLVELLAEDVVVDTVGFGIFFALGTRYRQLTRRHLLALAGLLVAGLVVFFEVRTGAWSTTQRWKWPPRFPYLAYAGMCGLTMAAAFRHFDVFHRLGRWTPIRTASAASLWFFFWHSFTLQLWNIFVGRNLFLIEVPVNVVVAYGLLTLEQHLVRSWLRRDLSDRARSRIRTVFAIR